MYSTNQPKTSPEEGENNASNPILPVKERVKAIESLIGGIKQPPIGYVEQIYDSHDLKQCNTEYKSAFSSVISNGSDSSITPKMDEAGTDRFGASVSPLVSDEENIDAAFNALWEENKIGYNRPYSRDYFEAASGTSSNSKTYNTIEVQKEEEDRKLGGKPKPLSRTVMLQQDNSKNVASPSPRTAANHVPNIIHNGETIYSEINPDTKSPKKSLEGSDSGISDQSPEMKRSNSEGTTFEERSEEEFASNRLGDPIYEIADLNTKFSKRSLEGDSGIDNRSAEVTRSNSQVTETSEFYGSQEWEDIPLNHDSPVILSTSSTEKSDGEVNSETPLIKTEKKTNRILPRVKYAVQQKGFIIFSVTALALSTSAALVYLQDKAQFIAFFANNPFYITIPIIAIASSLTISPILCAVKQFKSTEECQIQGKDANEALNKVLEYQRKDKVIKSVRLEYSNGTHSNFTLNAWKSEKNFINIDEKVISRRNKVEAVIKDRPIFTVLLTAAVATNIALPLGLLAIGGVNNVKIFYQNPLSNNIGLSLLIGSSMAALLIVCLGVHYYRKTNCTNLVYSEERIEPEKVNEKFIKEIKEERTKVLEENHGKEAKCSSLTLKQVVVESHNCKDAVYSIG